MKSLNVLMLLSLCLIVQLVSACPGIGAATGVARLSTDQKEAWEMQFSDLVVYPSDELPTDEGYWIDNGYGWQGDSFRAFGGALPYGHHDLAIPFCVSPCRLVYVGGRRARVDLSQSVIKLRSRGGRLAGTMTRQDDISSDQVTVWEVVISHRSKDNFYRANSKLSLVYVDASESFAVIEERGSDFLDGSIHLIDSKAGTDRVLSVDVWAEPGEHIRVTDFVPEQFSIELRLDGTAYLFSHWAAVMYDVPEMRVTQSVRQGRRMIDQQVCSGQAIVDRAKSTNFSVWLDVTTPPSGTWDECCIWLSPGVCLGLEPDKQNLKGVPR